MPESIPVQLYLDRVFKGKEYQDLWEALTSPVTFCPMWLVPPKKLALNTFELVLGSAMNCSLTSFPDLFTIFWTI